MQHIVGSGARFRFSFFPKREDTFHGLTDGFNHLIIDRTSLALQAMSLPVDRLYNFGLLLDSQVFFQFQKSGRYGMETLHGLDGKFRPQRRQKFFLLPVHKLMRPYIAPPNVEVSRPVPLNALRPLPTAGHWSGYAPLPG